MRPHAGKDENDGRRFRAFPCRLEPIGDAARAKLLKISGGFSQILEHQRQAVIEIGPVQGERGREIAGRYIGVASQQGNRARRFLLQCAGTVGGQGEQQRIVRVGLALRTVLTV
ncbi:MAG: hypothetical protein OXO51_05170 [Gemmatimonadota bacterium]|nr:hypothetical protein [Gemmatimonadota bacterium]